LCQILEAQPVGPDVVDRVTAAVTDYSSRLRGVFASTAGGTDFNSPARRACGKFAWTQWIDGTTGNGPDDAVYDLACVFVAATVVMHYVAVNEAGKQDDEEAMKRAFRALRAAISWITYVEETLLPELDAATLPQSMQPPSITFLKSLCAAHAQEFTVARAEAVGHDPALIAGLAAAATKSFSDAMTNVPVVSGSSGKKQTKAWQDYCRMKVAFFRADTYHHMAHNLASDKGGKKPEYGQAVKAGEAGLKQLEAAVAVAAQYAKDTKMTVAALPQVETTGRRMKKDADVMKRTNTLVHRARLPEVPPLLPDPHVALPANAFELPALAVEATEEAMTDLQQSVGGG